MDLSKRMIFRSSFLALWAVVMTTITVVLGAPPLRILRIVMGRMLFWAVAFSLSLIMFGVGWKALAIFFLLLTMLVGFYSELLDHEWTPLSSAAVSVSLTSMFGGVAFGLWTIRTGKGWYGQMLASVKEKFGQSPLLNGGIKLNLEDLILQAPSGMVVILLVASALLLVMEPRLREWAGIKDNLDTDYLKEFHLPDVFVWITMAALLGSFIKTDLRWVQVLSMNILNVCVLLYFFQGMAVFSSLFAWLKMSPFWRTLWTILLVLQLFVVVSVVGLVDYWANFRHKLKKRTTQINKTL